jgi:hypothetical protein
LGLVGRLKAHSLANDVVARAAIAAESGQLTTVVECLQALVALDRGYEALMDRTHTRLFKTRVIKLPEGYLVASTYTEDTKNEFKSLGMRWDPVQHGWCASSTGQLDKALKVLARAIPSREVLGPDGKVILLIEEYRV